MKRNSALAAAVLIYLAVSAAVILRWRAFPQITSIPDPAEFSAERAIEHVRMIAKAPHPPGVPAHAEVESYIVDQIKRCGYSPVLQDATVLFPRATRNYGAAYLRNILVKVPGRHSTKAVLIVSHYDSVRGSPGAADDGAGVATMLEMLRAVELGPAFANDIIFLFTDGEELGLLGAKAFVEQNALAREIEIVLNFEARGSDGPSIMFETSRNNGRLIQKFA